MLKSKKILKLLGLSAFFIGLGTVAHAASGIGAVASSVTANFGPIAKLITAGAYIAGLGFGVGAVVKFKAHKDNPTQVQLSQPIALLFVAAALMFIPSVFKSVGGTLYSGSSTSAGISGITNIAS
jgi:intracellular multiplication protein IcmD